MPGFKKLWDRICWMKISHQLEELVVGFEFTGAYGEPLVHYLRQKPVKLVQVNPMHTKRMKDSGNSLGRRIGRISIAESSVWMPERGIEGGGRKMRWC